MRTDKRIFALGFFDGVHLGHQALLRECCALAGKLNCGTAAITFDRHPQALFSRETPALLSTCQERLRLLREYGISAVYQLSVVKETMSMPWQDFLLMLKGYGAVGFVCGNDFRFGCRGEGDAEKLRSFCKAEGIPCVIVPEQTLDGIRISSTHIRSLLEEGKMEEANRFLGHPHTLTGSVVSGRKLGRKLGFPTANVLIPEGTVCPRHGVYACKATVEGTEYLAVTNVGSRPTVEGHQVRTEAWLLDFDRDLYGRELTLDFYSFLRPEQRFGSLEELAAAVRADGEQCRRYFANS